MLHQKLDEAEHNTSSIRFRNFTVHYINISAIIHISVLVDSLKKNVIIFFSFL